MEAKKILNIEDISILSDAIFKENPVKVFEAYSVYNQSLIRIESSSELLKYIKINHFNVMLGIYYPLAKGYMEEEKTKPEYKNVWRGSVSIYN